MTAKEIMITDVPFITIKTPVTDAVKILRKNFGDESYMNAAPGLVVLNDKGELAGILSPLTILKALLDSASMAETVPKTPDKGFYDTLCDHLAGKPVEQFMDWQAISVTENASLLDVADLFVKHRFQRIPVVKGATVVGVIYRSRLLFAMTERLLA